MKKIIGSLFIIFFLVSCSVLNNNSLTDIKDKNNTVLNKKELKEEFKIKSDLSIIFTTIQGDILKNKTPLKSYVIRDIHYEGEDLFISEKDYSSGEYKNIDLIPGKNYFVGTINFDILGLSGTLQDNSDYLIGVVEDGTVQYYQLFGNSKKGPIVKGNYAKRTDNATEGLIKLDGKIMVNGK